MKNYTIVTTKDQMQALKGKLAEWPFLAFDTETTGLNVRKDKVIGFSVCGEPGVAFYVPLWTWNKDIGQLIELSNNNHVAKELLGTIKSKELLTWNGSFDVRVVESNFGIDLTNSIVADGMLLKHTLEEEGNFALKKVAIDLQDQLGLDIEEEANKEQLLLKENVKANGGSTTKDNYEMFKADLDVMGPYACADTDLTFRICEYYLAKLEQQGLQAFFFDDEVMPLYKTVTIPMEKAGVKLDLELLEKSQREIEWDISNLEAKIESELLSLPEVMSWVNNGCDKIPTKPTGQFAQKYIEYFKLDFPKSAKTGKYLTKGLDVLSARESDIISIKRMVFQDQNDGKFINIFSKKQMGEIAFNHLGYDPISHTDKGTPQFNDEFIESIAGQAKWAAMLRDYNKLVKIKGSYIDRFLEGHEDGRFYFSYKQHGTISGRYGSDAQQLPRPLEEGSPLVLKYNNRIRRFFISNSSTVFLDCDYESLEPKTFSHVSNDEGLMDIFRSGKDFYSTIAIKTEGLHEYSPKKTDSNYLGKVAKQKRQDAKAYALGIPYGLGGYALGKTLDIPTEDAEVLVNGYLDAFPKLKQWMEDSKKQAQYNGYVVSELGRVRHLGKVKDIHAKFGEKLLDFKFRNKLGTKLPKEYVLGMYLDYKNGINNARNFQIQSMSASIVNRAAIKINEEFKRRSINGLVVAQIHDQLIMEVSKERADEASKIVEDIMENNIKLRVPLHAKPSQATNWADGH